jgi:hypothetical protein
MKLQLRSAALALTGFVALGAPLAIPAAGAEATEAYVREARQLTKQFATGLQSELKAAIEEGGPTHAIPVCREEAPGIAGQLSQQSGWAVGRTALRVRNPRNAPSVRERAVLIDFQARMAAGEPPQEIEQVSVIEEAGQRYLHYMKAIPTAQVCTACHGTDVKKELQATIRESYPADAATGFEVGELRGAFTFVRPLPGE